MTPADLILTESLVSGLGLALVHFLWQGSLVAFGLWLILRLLPVAAARVRYGAACSALLLMAVLPIVTLWAHLPTDGSRGIGMARLLQPLDASAAVAIGGAFDAVASPAGAPSAPAHEVGSGAVPGSRLDPMLPWLVTLWMAGVALLVLRLTGAWIYTWRLRRLAVPDGITMWQPAVERLARVMDLRCPVRVLDSAAVAVPTIAGWLKPMLLLPAAALSGLPPAQVEGLIAHELAHIRRHDPIVNLLQSVMETLLFYHPAVWWVSRRIRVEREFCCDDEAVRAGGDPLEYARGLAALEEQRAALLALAATGGSLLDRIHRLLGEPAAHGRRGGLVPATLLAAAALVSVGVLLSAGERTVHSRDGGPAITEVWPGAPVEQAMAPRPALPQISETPDDVERALAGIRAAREHVDGELARVKGYAAGLPDEERHRILDHVILQLERHRAVLERAEAEVALLMAEPDPERRRLPAPVIAGPLDAGTADDGDRGESDGLAGGLRGGMRTGVPDQEQPTLPVRRDPHRLHEIERRAERIVEELARRYEHWEPSPEVLRRIEEHVERLAEEAARRAEEVRLSPEMLRRLEEEAERMAGEVRRQLEESERMREAVRSIQAEAARIALEASRVAAEVRSMDPELLKELAAEAQRITAEVRQQMQSPEWQERMRELERAIEEMMRSLEERGRTSRPRP